MADFTLVIRKNDIYEEVAKTTAYIGKMTTVEDGKSAFDQIFVTDADLAMGLSLGNSKCQADSMKIYSVPSIRQPTRSW